MARPVRPRPGIIDSGHNTFGFLVAGTIAVVAGTAWIPVMLADPPGYTGGGPLVVAIGLVKGDITWTLACTLWLVGEIALILALLVAGLLIWRRLRRGRTRVDDTARLLATRADVAHLAPAGAAASAKRLRPSMGDTVNAAATGAMIGDKLPENIPLRSSWEDNTIDVWGPRRGKTTGRAIPVIVDAPGPVLVTSNKGDVVDGTRDLRATVGTVWVFDPQNLTGEKPTWYWNPLRPVTDITSARRLAGHFGSAELAPGAKRDAFFDPTAEELNANFMLAAAVSNRTILDPFAWSTNPLDDTPVRMLRHAGHELAARAVEGVMNYPEKMRGSVYGTAQQHLRPLTDPAVTQWLIPQPGRPELDAARLSVSFDTLYLLSEGGPGSPAPLVAALTDAVLQAAKDHSRTMPGRRLDPPMLGVLDEAANICRIRDLPAYYSYFGSMGICLITILQTWTQGAEVWGDKGMRRIWDSANVRTYGGGIADPKTLGEIAQLIGDHDVTLMSTTHSNRQQGGRSISHQTQRRKIMEVSDLAALPFGRMILLPSGSPPALLRTCPWQTGPHADAIRASFARWDPHANYDITLGDPDAGTQDQATIVEPTP